MNLRPLAYQARTLATELLLGIFLDMVRPVGFEPTTFWLKASCSTKLSYGRILEARCFWSCIQERSLAFLLLF